MILIIKVIYYICVSKYNNADAKFVLFNRYIILHQKVPGLKKSIAILFIMAGLFLVFLPLIIGSNNSQNPNTAGPVGAVIWPILFSLSIVSILYQTN